MKHAMNKNNKSREVRCSDIHLTKARWHDKGRIGFGLSFPEDGDLGHDDDEDDDDDKDDMVLCTVLLWLPVPRCDRRRLPFLWS
mmetsp:Transcript_18148/g.41664  ORF Transcript_18148/g.41664 Transcript_18148/m.41664 type:complete len:84 (+) Transcript_18148:1115-1366(+)